MDVLTLILRTVRQQIEATGVPPDQLQDALSEAERLSRSSLGGAMHHISRAPNVAAKARIIDLAAQGLSTSEVSERLGVSPQWVRRVYRQLRGDS
jgi:DNA invertase Pin-like site-specific DNA recombinase